jgi:dTMP kinase
VTLEGGEGAGKSTQATLLAEDMGALLTREPGGTPTGEHIRTLLLDPALPPVSARAEVLLMLAARAQHIAQVVEPALAAGRDVVCDRFSGSTLAYQGYGRELGIDEISAMSRWASGGLEPDLVVLLEVDAAEARGRVATRGAVDRMETEGPDFFARVTAGFAALAAADPARWRVVNGVGTVEEVAARVRDAVGRGHGSAVRPGGDSR